ncbi:metalloprotease MEP1 [Metarhizium guizhouense ARSEF 977]|uniref:Metalloprotease MEP1 n=1 Tax=Metarhizium guizhouense (strain ARSEF 977) TaxID=1276136 RepID=A0A0B4GEC1_METGA|nr:metalloprotease MEP1 [Metarhizium guizhouense ARSEF 977]
MVMLPLLVSGLMAAGSVAGPMEMRGVEHFCSTRSLSLEERELHTRQSSQPDDGQEINLGFVLHFCCGQGGQCPSDSVAEKAVEDMNGLFADGKIRFSLQNVSRIADPLCTAGVRNDGAMEQLKAKVHQGNTSTLNIVYVPSNQGGGRKGACIKPEPGMDIARSLGAEDGCVVALDTLPKGKGGNGGNGVNSGNGGNGRPGGNKGSSGRPGGLFGRLFSRQDGGVGGGNAQPIGAHATVHETGHWLGEDHATYGGGGGGTGNIMEPEAMPNRQYSFSPDQLKRMRQMALARMNNQKAPVGNNNRPVIGNGDGSGNTGLVSGNGDGSGNTGLLFEKGGSDNTGGSRKPGRPTNPGFNPGPGSGRGQSTPFPGVNGVPGGSRKPVRPTNPGFNPGSGSRLGQSPPRPEANGVSGGSPTGNIDRDDWTMIKEVAGGDEISDFEANLIGARAEPEAEADESGLVHIARREGTEAEADESDLVHIDRQDDTGEPDGSGLIHIDRK